VLIAGAGEVDVAIERIMTSRRVLATVGEAATAPMMAPSCTPVTRDAPTEIPAARRMHSASALRGHMMGRAITGPEGGSSCLFVR
jgi:hypothetical protein